MDHTPSKQPLVEESGQKTLGRRELLKALAATGGAVTTASLLPGKWAKPVIEAGVLPAHAQGSAFLINVTNTQNGPAIGGITTTAAEPSPDQLIVTVQVTPAQAGISITDTVTVGGFSGVGPQTTDANGQAIFDYQLCELVPQGVNGQVQNFLIPFTIEYSFTDTATYGTDTASVSGTIDLVACFG